MWEWRVPVFTGSRFIRFLKIPFPMFDINARHIKNVPGHKTDKMDRMDLQASSGRSSQTELYSSQRARQLRDLTRYRNKLIQQIASEKNRMMRILAATSSFQV